MENENLDEVILKLYDQLRNPLMKNEIYVTNTLLEIYKMPKSISILINIILNSDSTHFYKQQALFGFKRCIEYNFNQLDVNDIKNIWNFLFQILLKEENENILESMILCFINMFKMCSCQNDIISVFLAKLKDQSYNKFLLLMADLSIYMDPRYILDNFDNLMSIIDEYIKRSQYGNDFRHVLLIFFSLTSSVIGDHADLYDSLIQKYSTPFSNIAIIELENEQHLKSVSPIILMILEKNINIFSLKILFQPIISILSNQIVSYHLKYMLILILSCLLECDKDSSIDFNIIQQVILLSIQLSFAFFDRSDDVEEPDSSIFLDFFYNCVYRIPLELIHEFAFPIIQQLSISNSYSNIYTLIIFLSALIRRSSKNIDILFQNNSEKNSILEMLFSYLQINNPGIRNELCYLLCSLFRISSFIKILQSQLEQIVQMIIQIIIDSHFEYGYFVLENLIKSIDDSDLFFNQLFAFCSQQISQPEITTIILNWEVLSILIKQSKHVAHSNFDILYSKCIQYLEENFKNKNCNSNSKAELIIPSILNCLASLIQNSCDLMIGRIDQFFKLIQYILSVYNDYEIINQSITCIKIFISKFDISLLNEEYINFIYITSINLINIDKGNHSLLNIAQGCEYSNSVISVSIHLLAKLCKLHPSFFDDKMKISTIISIFHSSFQSIFNKEIIASLHLFRSIIFILSQVFEDIESPPDMIILYTKIIFEKMLNDINIKVITKMMKTINSIISSFGIDAIADMQIPIFTFSLDNIYKNENKFTHELYINREYLSQAGILMSNIINSISENDLKRFIDPYLPKILPLFNSNQDLFAFALSIVTPIIINSKLDSGIIMENDLICIIKQGLSYLTNASSHEAESEINYETVLHSLIFFISLGYNYQNFLNDASPYLLKLIENETTNFINFSQTFNQDKSSFEDFKNRRCLVEYYLALFTMIDNTNHFSQIQEGVNNIQVNFINEEKMRWFLEFLPIQYSQSYTNKFIFMFLLKYYNIFPSLQIKMLSLFSRVFISSTTLEDSHIPPYILKMLLSKLNESNILENEDSLSMLFQNNPNDRDSFLMTFNFLLRSKDFEII